MVKSPSLLAVRSVVSPTISVDGLQLEKLRRGVRVLSVEELYDSGLLEEGE